DEHHLGCDREIAKGLHRRCLPPVASAGQGISEGPPHPSLLRARRGSAPNDPPRFTLSTRHDNLNSLSSQTKRTRKGPGPSQGPGAWMPGGACCWAQVVGGSGLEGVD